MSYAGKHLGGWLGGWLGESGETAASYVDAALFVVGEGTALLWPDVINRAPPVASGGGYGFLPEKKPRRDTDDDLLMCFLL